MTVFQFSKVKVIVICQLFCEFAKRHVSFFCKWRFFDIKPLRNFFNFIVNGSEELPNVGIGIKRFVLFAMIIKFIKVEVLLALDEIPFSLRFWLDTILSDPYLYKKIWIWETCILTYFTQWRPLIYIANNNGPLVGT